MKTSSFEHPLKIILAGLLAFIGGTLPPCNAQVDAASNQAVVSAPEAHVISSPAIRDILKMLDAKVDIEVVKAYIKSSSIAFNPTASDIIELKRRGVPDELITTLMQRGAEVRAQMAQAVAAQGNVPLSAPNAPPQGYGYDYSTAPAYPYTDYASDYPYYPYYGYPYYANGYPYNYWWYNAYPWAFYSPFFFGRGFHDFDRFHHFDRGFDRFHGGRSFAFQGRGGFGNRSFVGRSGGFSGRSFAMGGVRTGGFAGRSGGGFAGRSAGGFAGRSGGGFAGHAAGGFGGHGGGGSGGHGGGHR